MAIKFKFLIHLSVLIVIVFLIDLLKVMSYQHWMDYEDLDKKLVIEFIGNPRILNKLVLNRVSI
jgi:hypothetical protein